MRLLQEIIHSGGQGVCCRLQRILVGILLLISPLYSGHAAGQQDMGIQPLLETLDRANVSGSLELSGSCDLRSVPNLPSLRTSRSRGSVLDAVREMLLGDQNLQVTQDSNGIIRIKQLGIPSDILDIRIKHIQFQSNAANGQRDIFDPNSALELILQAPEVVFFMKHHRIKWRYEGRGVTGNIVGTWPSALPHLSGSLSDVTVSQALDWTLRTFPGIWLYENCDPQGKGERMVYLRFYRLQRVGSVTRVVGG